MNDLAEKFAGRFIVLDGPDGSGKSTQLAMLAEYLGDRGVGVITTRDPGGTAIGDRIRAVLHNPEHKEMDPAAEILLYSASRAQLVAQVIRPALQVGKVVLCDRYADSTTAYQGYGRGLDLQVLKIITTFATRGLKPDLTLLLDIEVEAGLARRQVGGGEWNRMDQQALEFHRLTREGFLKMAAAEPDRWTIIDASGPKECVAEAIWAVVSDALESS